MLTVKTSSKSQEQNTRKLAVNSVEACQLLGISPTTMTAWVREGKIPHRRIGRRLLFSVKALEEFLDNMDSDKQ